MPISLSEDIVRKIPHGCLVKLQAIYDSLKTAEKKAADLLIARPDFFASATIVESAQEAGCSEATMMRLARRLGFDGYPDLKNYLLRERETSPVLLYEGITGADDPETVVKKVFNASIQSLTDTLNILHKEEYKKAVEAICTAKKIVLCGMGDAFTVAQSGFQKFIRIGYEVYASPDLDLQLIAASHMAPGDVLLAISHSGRTRSLVDVVKYARTTEATTISITNYPVSPLAKNSDIILLTAVFAEHMQGEVMAKRITELCVLESLYISVLLKRQAELADDLRKSNLSLEVNKL
ncbi:MAG: MurR/RpiR family transcriptional regulator [Bacillota bacterium]